MLACSAQAYTFKIKVDLASQPEKQPVQLTVPKGAEKASARYFRLAEKTHPDLLAHGFAAPPGQATFKRDDDPLDDLAGGLVDDDAILTFDKDVEYVIRAAGRRSFVLMVNSNNRKIDMPIALDGLEFAGEPVVKSVTIAEGHVHSHLIPGERPLWTVSEDKLAPFEGGKAVIPIGPNTAQSVTIPLRPLARQ